MRNFTFHSTFLYDIRSLVGTRSVSIKAPSAYSTEWAGLETVGIRRVADFLDKPEEGQYLFDWSLPINAPELGNTHTHIALNDRLKSSTGIVRMLLN